MKVFMPEKANKSHSSKWKLLKPEPRYLLARTRLWDCLPLTEVHQQAACGVLCCGVRRNATTRKLNDPCSQTTVS